MTEYLHQRKLTGRAIEFIEALQRAGIQGAIATDSFREYSVKIAVSKDDRDFGNAIIYYRSKSDSFSMKTHELKDRSIAPVLERCWQKQLFEDQPDASYEIYVDGSFINGTTGYGLVILRAGEVLDEIFGAVEVEDVNGTRQIAGELIAVKEALKWCDRHSVAEVSIYYDYLGIEKWATGKWKANQPLTQEYSRFVRESRIKINWYKVDSHTGNRWNDRADALAKKGAGTTANKTAELDLVSELIEKTDHWIEFLMLKGIEACFDRVYNDQFARIYIICDALAGAAAPAHQDKPIGTFDLYNTKKKRFTPRLHNFEDDLLMRRLEMLWTEFSQSEECL